MIKKQKIVCENYPTNKLWCKNVIPNYFIISFVAIILISLGWGCKKGDTTNNEPNAFKLLAPKGDNQNTKPTFNWEKAIDPNGETITYNIYISRDSSTFFLLKSDIIETEYTIHDTLELNGSTTYFWKIIARDERNAMRSSDTAHFSTSDVEQEGSIKLNSQKAIDSFGANKYSRVKGNLIISGPDIINLDTLKNLVIIDSNLIITNNPKLETLVGLQNIKNIGDNLIIENNGNLVSCDGLQTIYSVNGSLNIRFNGALTSINRFENISDIGGDLTVEGNVLLRNLEGLATIGNLGGALKIENNDKLTDIRGLQGIGLVNGDLVIKGNKLLEFLEGLNNISSTMGSLIIEDNIILINLSGLRNIASVQEQLTINNNDKLANLIGLQNIVSVKNLMITNNKELKNLCSVSDLIVSEEGGETINTNTHNTRTEGNCSQ